MSGWRSGPGRRTLSILLDDTQTMLSEEAGRLLRARRNVPRLLTLLEQPGQFDHEFWDDARAQGWTGMAIGEAHGGLGLGLIELGLVARQCGSVTAGAPFLPGHHAAAWAMAPSQDRDGIAAMIASLACGDRIGTVSLSGPPGPLPNPSSLRYWGGTLSGVAQAVVGGCHADIVVVWALAGDEPALVVVEAGHARRDNLDTFDNSRGHANLSFDAAPAIILCDGDRAQALGRDILGRIAVIAAFEQLGGAEAMMLAARDYANERHAFGQPIGRFQSVKHRIAELYVLVELARANCLHAATREGAADFLLAAASARLSASEAYDTAVRDAIQIHGGVGVTWEGALHLHMRRARSLMAECGNALWWEDLLVDELCRSAA